MILILNILLSVIVVVGIVGLLAYNIRPLRRPLRLDESLTTHVAARSEAGRRDHARRAHPYAPRRSSEPTTRSLDSARA